MIEPDDIDDTIENDDDVIDYMLAQGASDLDEIRMSQWHLDQEEESVTPILTCAEPFFTFLNSPENLYSEGKYSLAVRFSDGESGSVEQSRIIEKNQLSRFEDDGNKWWDCQIEDNGQSVTWEPHYRPPRCLTVSAEDIYRELMRSLYSWKARREKNEASLLEINGVIAFRDKELRRLQSERDDLENRAWKFARTAYDALKAEDSFKKWWEKYPQLHAARSLKEAISIYSSIPISEKDGSDLSEEQRMLIYDKIAARKSD